MFKKEGKQPEAPGIQNGAEGHEGGPTDWSIQGQQAHNPESSGTEHEEGFDKMPTRRAQVTKLDRRAGREGKRRRTE